MTSGNRTFSSQDTLFEAVLTTYYPSYSRVVLGTAMLGTRHIKTWSGSDDPVSNPLIENFSYTFEGKVYEVSRPKDATTRLKRVDHPYSMNNRKYNNDWIQEDHYAWNTVAVAITETRTAQYTPWPAIWNDSYWDSNDDIALIGRLRTEIAGSDFHFGVFLGEGQKALAMIAENATRIFRAVNAFKRGDIRKTAYWLKVEPSEDKIVRIAKARARSLSKGWLELQYGWLPLLKDVEGGAQFLAKHLELPFIKTYRARFKKPLRFNMSTPNVLLNPKGKGQSTGQIIARMEEESVYKMSGLLDPLSVAWELLPWSFVADWFIPIGNYLSARSFVSSLKGTFVTTKVVRWERGATSPQPTRIYANDYYVYSRIGTTYESWIQMDRTVTTSLSVPFPNFKPLGSVPSWKRAANSVALIVTAFVK